MHPVFVNHRISTAMAIATPTPIMMSSALVHPVFVHSHLL
jgi:hypothetical protein